MDSVPKTISWKKNMPDFHGEPIGILENQFVELEYTLHATRVVRFTPKGGDNLLADVWRKVVDTPYGEFRFRGGHRLWHAPESMPRTYIPDNDGGVVSEIQDGVRIEMPAEALTQIAKAIEIRLNPDRPQAILRHELRNDGAFAVEFAPWALTMLRPGGVAVFPQSQGNVDETGLLPNRQLTLWPYARITDPRLVLRDDFLLVHATPSLPPFKLGYFNPLGWTAYWLAGTLFVKRYEVQADAVYPDHGCNTETYCNDEFIELESLGPLRQVAPGQTVTHTEIWEIYNTLDVPFLPEDIRAAIRKIA